MRRKALFVLLGFIVVWTLAWHPLMVPLRPYAVTVRVQQGDTLWRICDRAGMDYQDPRDVREIIYYTRLHNRLDQRITLQPGQEIVIPLEVPK